MKNVAKIIDLFGGMAKLKSNALRIANEPYMALCIEHIGTGPRDLPLVSVAHYYEQNGDLMRDPDMTFEVDSAGNWFPITYRQDGLGIDQEAVFHDDAGRLMIRSRLARDLKSFSRQWDKNIKDQGFIDKAKAVIAAAASPRY